MSGYFKGKALLVVGMQLLAVFSILSVIQVTPVQGTAVPDHIDGDWVITGNETYWGGTCDLNSGNLIIGPDATLTLHKVTLRMNPNGWGGNNIAVLFKGNLVIEDSTIMSGNGDRFNWTFDFGSKGTIKNTVISDITQNFMGLPIGIQTSGVTFDGNDISNSDAGIYADGTASAIRPNIVNNTFHDIDGFALMSISNSGKFSGNTVKNCNQFQNGFSSVVIAKGNPTFDNNTFTNNQGGLTVAAMDKMEIWDSTFQDASSDILVEALDETNQPYDTAVATYNTVFSTVAINTIAAQGQGAPPEGKGSLSPFWRTDVQVKRLSDGRPVAGATIEVGGAKGTKLLTGVKTDSSGLARDIYVPESRTYNPGAKQDGTPSPTGQEDYKAQIFWANASFSGCCLSGNTSMPINKNGLMVNVTIDDVPAPLMITEPVNGLITNETGVDIKGKTDPMVYLTIKGTPVQVATNGDFGKFLGLIEGKNDILVQATKPSGIQTNVTLHVTRDTVPPVVKILSPANGSRTNVPDLVMSGTAELGSELTINGKIVPVLADKTFNTTIHLAENDNTITALDRDKAGNVGTSSIVVTLHTAIPSLGIYDPSDNKRTKDENLTIKGIADKDTNVTINGNLVPLGGTGTQFQYTIRLKEGENDIVIRAVDPEGNVNQKVLTVYLDTIPPSLAITSPADGAVTNQDSIVVTGITDPGTTVKVNGQVVDNIGGAFSKEVPLTASQNKITIDAVDSVGNAVTKEIHVNKKTIPPDLNIQSPKDGQVLNAQAMGKVEVRGKTDPNAKVYVNGEKAGMAGISFQSNVYLAEGNNTIQVAAYDEAGNINTVTLHVTYDSQVNAEILTPVNELNTSADFVMATGFVEPGATVRINNVNVPVTPAGGFSQSVKLDKGRDSLSFVMTDKAGNSLAVTRYVNRGTGGNKPSQDAMTLNLVALILIVVVVVAIVAVLAMGRRKKVASMQIADDEPLPPDLSSASSPPPPDFGAGGVTPPSAYGDAAPQQGYTQEEVTLPPEEQGQAYGSDAEAEMTPSATELPLELAPVTTETQPETMEEPEPLDEEEDMTPKRAPMPEDAPQPTMKFKDLPGDDEVAEGTQKRKSEAWSKREDKPRDVLDEILDEEQK